MRDAGATIVGGCCGTTPDHLRAMAGLARRFDSELFIVPPHRIATSASVPSRTSGPPWAAPYPKEAAPCLASYLTPTTSRSSPTGFDWDSRSAGSTAGTSRSTTPTAARSTRSMPRTTLLLSGASLLRPEESDAFIELAIARAQGVEAASFANGDRPPMVAAKVTAVLVSAAVRAAVIARGRDVSPSALNRATLSWYEVQEMRRRELLQASIARRAFLAVRPEVLGGGSPRPAAARHAVLPAERRAERDPVDEIGAGRARHDDVEGRPRPRTARGRRSRPANRRRTSPCRRSPEQAGRPPADVRARP